MASYAFERLSAQDAGFLWAETPNQPMHVGALAVFEAGPLVGSDGGIDIARYRRQVESVLHWIPRYRQKIEWTPVEGWPLWVDDRNFDIGYHIRHIALPRPGTTEQLKELAARINSRRLDRRHALWEVWLIEGVEDGEQFAILNKIHHCMIDGAAGADLSQILMSPSKQFVETEPVPYMPRPQPTSAELFVDAVSRSVTRPVRFLRDSLEKITTAPTRPPESLSEREPRLEARIAALAQLAISSSRRASATPLNGELGPHRRLEWLTMSLDDVKELRRVLDCTINDVVLATVAGAIRRYLFRRRVDHRTIDFRVAAPVSMRKAEHDRRQGNHVSTWVVPLPLALEDPLERLDAIRRATAELKDTDASLAVDTIMNVAEWIPGPILSRTLETLNGSGPVNTIVTNVPGPQFPLYLAGAKLLAMYPIVPLIPGGGLGVALFSYEGKLCWGFNGDYELVPDLPAFKADIQESFEALRQAAVDRFLSRRTAAAEPVEEVAPPAPVARPVAPPAPAAATTGEAERRPSRPAAAAAPAPSAAAAPAPPAAAESTPSELPSTGPASHSTTVGVAS